MKELEKKYTSLKYSILEQIDKEKISPHTKLYFWLKASVMFMGVGILFFTIVYTVSLILFTLSKSGILLLSPFGFFGIFSLLNDLPWILVLVSLFALFALLLLAKNTFSVYRMPLIYLFLFVIGFVGTTGLIVAKSRIHPYIVHHFGEREGNEFHQVRMSMKPESHSIYFGTLLATTTDLGYISLLRDGVRVEVKVNKMTRIFTPDTFDVGDKVLLFGEKRGDIIFANAVREITKRDIDDLEIH